MTEQGRRIEEWPRIVSGMLAGLGGIFAALSGFFESFKKMLDSVQALNGMPSAFWFAVATFLLLVAFWLIRDALASRSLCLKPEALSLQPDDPKHLKGRKGEVASLIDLCRNHQQVHLVGESGAGKSALIKAGLCSELRRNNYLLCIYIEDWGEHWETGPLRSLAEAVWSALSESDREKLKLTKRFEANEVFGLIRSIRQELGLTPLCIFDQFDDYQTTHRAHFIHLSKGTWLDAKELADSNAFWRNLQNLIRDDIIHCLFVTRSDASAGLESIRFQAPQTYQLDRLDKSVVLQVLAELTATGADGLPVISAPERGWDRLKQRLADDLGHNGDVLAAQMRLAFQGLSHLRYLTVWEYEKMGGLAGLEAAYIEKRVRNAANHSGLNAQQIRNLLHAMVDPQKRKTLPQSFDALRSRLRGRFDVPSIQLALEDFVTKEVVRKRVDPETGQGVWSLHHDYLCRGVIEAERRANRWASLAQEAFLAWQGARGVSVWSQLLSPWQQIVLAWQRVRGAFRYGDLRGFALVSLLRFAPYVLVLVGGTSSWRYYLNRAEATRLMNRVVVSHQASPPDWSAYEELSNTTDEVRGHFFALALEPSYAIQFRGMSKQLTRALVGLSPQSRDALFSEGVMPCLRHDYPDTAQLLCINIGISLDKNEDGEFIERAFARLKNQTPAVRSDEEVLEGFERIAPKLSSEQAKEAAAILVREIAQAKSDKALLRHARLLGALPIILTDEQSSTIVAPLLPALVSNRDDEESFRHLARALARISKLDVSQGEVIVKTFYPSESTFWTREMEDGSEWPWRNEEKYRTLLEIMADLTARLPPGLLQPRVEWIVAEIERSDRPFHRAALGLALASLAKVPGVMPTGFNLERGQRIQMRMLDALQPSNDGGGDPSAALAIVALAGIKEMEPSSEMTARQRQILKSTLDALARDVEPLDYARLLLILVGIGSLPGGISNEVPPALIQEIFGHFLETFKNAIIPTADPDDAKKREVRLSFKLNFMPHLTQMMKTIPGSISPVQVEQGLFFLTDTLIPQKGCTWEAQRFSEVLTPLMDKLPTEAVPKALDRLLSTLEVCQGSNTVSTRDLMLLLSAVPGTLSEPQKRRLDAIFQHIDADSAHWALAARLMPVQESLNLLRRPALVGSESMLVQNLEQATGQDFDKSLWKAMVWMQGHYNIDAEARPLTATSPQP